MWVRYSEDLKQRNQKKKNKSYYLMTLMILFISFLGQVIAEKFGFDTRFSDETYMHTWSEIFENIT